MSTIHHHQKKTNSIQDKIVKCVNEIPGIRYRELLRITGISNGVLSYHLNLLDNSGKIRVNRVNNRVTRYFSYDVSLHETYVIGLLRQETSRKIIMYILEKGTCGFNDIIIHTRKVPSTISWHMARLKAANIVKVRKQYEFNYYEIGMDRLILQDLLSKYKSSFTEKIVDDYIDMINEF
ncbi:MAG: ArsR family transcriptional regulator [Nitrososphaeraceae archaeon]|jgi:predicted transcriptional regulator|nr:ArsR family transcriptional regulator [Nitrososphaeraceae archaeon]